MKSAGYSANFSKRYRHIDTTIRESCNERLKLFLAQPFHQLLDNHALKGGWKGYRSINVTGDWRAIFKMVDPETAYFVAIDTHHNLYGT
jgi:addiction module RelE/StbE family toxin